MTMKTAITYEELTRQERLLIWLRRANLNNAQIAEALNVSAIAISRWFRAESISCGGQSAGTPAQARRAFPA